MTLNSKRNDDEIVTSVLEESDPVGDDTDKDEDNNSEIRKSLSNDDVFSALETAMETVVFSALLIPDQQHPKIALQCKLEPVYEIQKSHYLSSRELNLAQNEGHLSSRLQ
ncbi:hypothetical protein TNCV_1934461 [Trichonephila clavipes]|nr:hypothetical protein TNCV_1934461 [Trichonephila clavipes]